MAAAGLRSLLAAWLLLHVSTSVAAVQVEETAHPRAWLAPARRGGQGGAGGGHGCSPEYVRSRVHDTGGRAIRCADTPYAAALLRTGVHAPCAATIVSPSAVLSVAQCHSQQAMVLAGNSQYLNDLDFEPPTQFRLTSKCVMYDAQNATVHDIMVCFVNEPFLASLYVNKISVLGTQVKSNLSCLVTGFGLGGESQAECLVGRSILQQIPNVWDCPKGRKRASSWVCTSDTTQSVCLGDMGAGAICRVGGHVALVAVASGVLYKGSKVEGSCGADVVGNVYIQVSTYMKWLRTLVSDLDKPLADEPQPPWLLDRHRGLERSNMRSQHCLGSLAARGQVSWLCAMGSMLLLVPRWLAVS